MEDSQRFSEGDDLLSNLFPAYDFSLGETANLEIVLFYGPPCSGKTNYYQQHYSTTHVRVSFKEEVEVIPNYSVENFIQHIIELLKQGNNIVIDDENKSGGIRELYLSPFTSLIQNGNIKFIAVCFEPLGGIQQCIWLNEWKAAERSCAKESLKNPPIMANASITSTHKSYDLINQKRIEEWYQTGCIPTKEEGFTEIRTVSCRLFYDIQSMKNGISENKFSTRACVIDFGSLFSFSSSDYSNPHDYDVQTIDEKFADHQHIHNTLSSFIKLQSSPTTISPSSPSSGSDHHSENEVSTIQQSSPLILFLIDEEDLFHTLMSKEIFELKEMLLGIWRTKIKEKIQSIANHINHPVYALVKEYNLSLLSQRNDSIQEKSSSTSSFLRFIAWMQYRHSVDLSSSTFVYLKEGSPAHSTFSTLGLKYVISSLKLFEDSESSFASKIEKLCDTSNEMPEFLREIEFSSDSSLNNNTNSHLPLQTKLSLCQVQTGNVSDDDVMLLDGDDQITLNYADESYAIGNLHMVCFPHKEFTNMLDQTPSPPVSSVSQSSPSSPATNNSSEDVSSSSAKSPISVTFSPPSSAQSLLQAGTPPTTPRSPVMASPISIPPMSEYHVRSLVSPTSFDNGESYYDHNTVFHRYRSGNKLTAMCKGSSRPAYSISIILNQKTGLVKSSSCSCPVPVTCKHIAAVLLNWVHKPSKFKCKFSDFSPSPSPSPLSPPSSSSELTHNHRNNNLSPPSSKRTLPAWMCDTPSPQSSSSLSPHRSSPPESDEHDASPISSFVRRKINFDSPTSKSPILYSNVSSSSSSSDKSMTSNNNNQTNPNNKKTVTSNLRSGNISPPSKIFNQTTSKTTQMNNQNRTSNSLSQSSVNRQVSGVNRISLINKSNAQPPKRSRDTMENSSKSTISLLNTKKLKLDINADTVSQSISPRSSKQNINDNKNVNSNIDLNFSKASILKEIEDYTISHRIGLNSNIKIRDTESIIRVIEKEFASFRSFISAP